MDAEPTPLWQASLQRGFSALVADQQHVYSVSTENREEVCECRQLADGRRVWRVATPVKYRTSSGLYDAAHATPAITADRIVVVTIDGLVRCLNRSTGRPLWKQTLTKFGMQLPQSGYASSPLIVGDKVILPTLGKAEPSETERYRRPQPDDPPGAVALDLRSGNTLWRSASFRSSHASAVLVSIQQTATAVLHGMFELVGLNPLDGSILWRHRLRDVAADNVSFTPLWDAERRQMLICHGYCEFGAQAIRVERDGSEWTTRFRWNNTQLRIVHTNAVLAKKLMIGTNREPATLLVAVDLDDGRTVGRVRGSGKSNFLTVGDDVLQLDESGELRCWRWQGRRPLVYWKRKLLRSPAWTVPTVSSGRILVRDDRQLQVLSVRG